MCMQKYFNSYYLTYMKKIWIVSSVFIISIVFIYAMTFVSSQNICTWVRSYECLALEKQRIDTQWLLQQQQQTAAKKLVRPQTVTQTISKPVVQQPVVQQPAIVPPPPLFVEDNRQENHQEDREWDDD